LILFLFLLLLLLRFSTTQIGHKPAFGNVIEQCYIPGAYTLVGDWFSIPASSRCPPQAAIGSWHACSRLFDYQIVKTIDSQCVINYAASHHMQCVTNDDSARILGASFGACPDVGHLLLRDAALSEQKTKGTAPHTYLKPAKFPAADARAGSQQPWFATPLAGAYLTPQGVDAELARKAFSTALHNAQ